MDYMELQFPEDAREQSVRQGRNISDAERWISMAGGVGLAAYGINKGRLPGWAPAETLGRPSAAPPASSSKRT